ncbi:GNAT family N-acetyltransferase (plasmid) [Lachnospiraceae bacterium C1.1]
MSRLKEIRKYVDNELNHIKDEDKRNSAFVHLYGVSLAAAMLAKRRGLNPELASMAAMLHDLNAYKTGSYDDHAHKGAELARKILNELQLTDHGETELICSAIYHHDDKLVKDSPMDELLKDADVIHHCMNDLSKPIKEKEQARYDKICNEFFMTETDSFEFRTMKAEEADRVAEIEQICFPPNEACTEKHMKERINVAQNLFLLAIDKKNNRIAGFINSIASNEGSFRDEFFTDYRTHLPEGENVMILGVDVLPEYRNQGLARKMMEIYKQRATEEGRKRIVLTCLDAKVEMYSKFGFKDLGMSASEWGGEKWHEMDICLSSK